MRISEVAKKFNISIQTLRYYEREELIPKIHRNSHGIRDYKENEIYWVHYVQALRRSGVSVASIKEYVRLVSMGKNTREQRRQILINQREMLLQKRALIDDALNHMNIKLEIYDKYVIDLENNTADKNGQV